MKKTFTDFYEARAEMAKLRGWCSARIENIVGQDGKECFVIAVHHPDCPTVYLHTNGYMQGD